MAKENNKQTIWLCRHGNRIDFVDPNWKGEHPFLSEDGIVQAKETGERLKGEGIRYIFSSPFLRTIETAHYIAEALDLRVYVENGAMEWLNADWFDHAPESPPIDRMIHRFPRLDTRHTSLIAPVYPESDEEALQRAGRASVALAYHYDGDLLIIGHGHSVWGMARGLLGKDVTISAGLCSLIKIVRKSGKWEMELSGDSSHLTGGEAHSGKFK